MLLSLHVKNLALIEEVEVEFGDGLNILTGETGAGKSIIIGSLNLALGEKPQKEMLRENVDYALVELVFQVEDPRTLERLLELDVVPEDGQVIMSRKVMATRSIGKINSESVSASRMREVASLLIDIHGQHENETLLQKRRHLEILDEYAKDALAEKKEELSKVFSEYQSLKKKRQEATTDAGERARELSFLEYEIQEIEDADLKPGEDEALEAEYRRMANGKKILEAIGEAHELTAGTSGADGQISRALRELSAVAEYDGRLSELLQQLSDVDGLLNDFNRDLSDYMADAEFSEEEFYQVEQRLDTLNRLKAKYGDSLDDILRQKEEKEKRLEILKNYEAYLEDLKERLARAEERLDALSHEVSKIRKEYAKELSAQVTEALEQLNFLDVSFSMEFSEDKPYSANGIDEPEFVISTNPGEPPKPLHKVASGGELSRVMLAIKTILAEQDAVGTMIFDEIDAGISGRTAQMVAEKMNYIAKRHQVICITHLPQIASMADTHFLIEKSVVNNATISTIRELGKDDSVDELARMIGGVRVTDTVRDSAREMKEMALSLKNSM